MKKIICAVLVFAMVLGTVCVYADDSVSLDFLKPNYEESCEMDMAITANTDQNLDVFDFFNDMFSFIPVEFSTLTDGLVSSEISANVKQVAKKNAISAQVDYSVKLPINLNKNLKTNSLFTVNSWIDMDYSDIDDIKTSIVQKTPFETKYEISDIGGDEFSAISFMFPTSPYYNAFYDEYIDLISSNADVSKWSNRVTVKVSDEQLSNMFSKIIIASAFSEDDSITEILDGLKSIKNQGIINFDSLSCEYILDSRGRISSSDATLKFNVDVLKLADAAFLDRYEIDSDDTTINFGINMKCKYKYAVPKIDYPVLTDENSYKVDSDDDSSDYNSSDDDNSDYDIGDDYDEWYYNASDIYFSDGSMFENYINTGYIPLRYVFDDLSYNGNYTYDISFENGKIHITSDDNFDLLLTEFSNEVIFNGQTIFLDTPVIENNGICFINNEFMEKVFNLIFMYGEKVFEGDNTIHYHILFE